MNVEHINHETVTEVHKVDIGAVPLTREGGNVTFEYLLEFLERADEPVVRSFR